ncbi:HAD family acid phosphatase [Jatrophihabitans sp.]|uniref:HAD family acid phosphatase n=1 Tax=Jatrophihabitans sp. TaxID=1932789 RepID=UPI0030C6A507|nr:acid phosphatase [Jatrophihabitans sp.]
MPETTSTTEPRTRRRPRVGRARPILVGAVIAAAGLVLGGVATALASGGAPRHGDAIPNVTTVENQIKAYYGSVPGSLPGVGAVTLPDPNGNYAKEVRGIEVQAKQALRYGLSHHGRGKPAIVLDVDDTSLNTYDYEISSQFGYTPASNATFVLDKAFPAVFGMPTLANWAQAHGYTVFFITGRPESQRAATAGNLADVGFSEPTDPAHLFLKQSTPVSYLPCSTTSCTTIQYKAGTRAYLSSLGYTIVSDFGDQYSDLEGGHAGNKVKLPNPMYFLP